MRFIPDYRVCYKGEFYECDEEFEIDPADADEMREHGEIVEESSPPAEPEEPEPEEPEPEESEEMIVEKPRRGRRRKNDEPGADETQDG